MKSFLFSLLLTLVAIPAFAQQAATRPEIARIDVTVNSDGSFVHTVFFWLKNRDSEADRHKLYEGLQTLSQIDLVRKAYIGVPAPTDRDVIDRSYDYSITFIFQDKAEQDAYQVHPDHLKFVEDYGHLWERVVVYDAVPPSF